MKLVYRKAKISDVEEIYKLVNYYANKNQMLARSRSSMYEGIREFIVVKYNDELVGVGSLHIIWEDLAEIRALAVAPQHLKKGIGRKLVQLFIEEACELGIKRVFSLTYQPGFFKRCGFQDISKDDLPQKVWTECINCPHFPNCEENAVIIKINE